MINGSKINDRYPVMSISVKNEINVVPKAEITLLDGDPATRDFLISDSDDFKPGNLITISAGYDTGPETVIFDGMVSKQGISISGGSIFISINVSCKHVAVKMTFNETDSATFDNKTEDSIIQSIFSDNYNLNGTVQSLPEARQTQQYMSSDWDFIMTEVR